MNRPLLERWLEELVATPGLTAIGDVAEARVKLVDDALRAASAVRATPGEIVDVGSGGGSPGIPLAVALPEREFTLLEAERRKCEFLTRFAGELPNVRVVWGRAETQPRDSFGVALAKALAKPPVAVEMCLPLLAVGGTAILWVGRTVERDRVEFAAEQLGGVLEDDSAPGLLAVRKVRATPLGFPRRPGMAKKRPLA